MDDGQNQQPSQEQVFDQKVLEALVFNQPMPTQPQEGQPAQPEGQTPAPEGQTQPEVQIPAAQTLDADAYWKGLGFENEEKGKVTLQELLKLKENPPVKELEFPDEVSKKYYKYIKEGKEDELYKSLHIKQQIKDIDTMNDEQRLKLFIKMNNPLYDQELIEAKFKRDYSFDENDFKDDDGNITDAIGLRLAKIDAIQKQQSDAAKANEFFNQYKEKINLPDIEPAKVNVDPDYEDYKASIASSTEAYTNVIAPALNSLKESDVLMGFNLNDQNNQMQIEGSVTIDPADFEAAKKAALNYMEYMNTSFYDKDGKFQPANVVRAILRDKNWDKYTSSIARQAVNAERKRVIEKETPGNGNTKNYSVELPSELQELEKMVFPNGNGRN